MGGNRQMTRVTGTTGKEAKLGRVTVDWQKRKRNDAKLSAENKRRRKIKEAVDNLTELNSQGQ